ncbi:MAG TPA: hypothetical protein VIL55_07130 [Naasia sp.]|jgi:hypothetical protein
MEILESAVERYDRLHFAGVLRFAGDGLAQWCVGCRTSLMLPLPEQISHDAIDALADGYADHVSACFAGRLTV